MRSGATLVEVLLAGALAVMLTLACLEGVIVSTRIAHENSQLLAAEAFAWDTAWKWLNKSYDDLNNSSVARFYPDVGFETISSNACPMLCKELNGGEDAKLYVRVRLLSGGETLVRHGTLAAVKQIDVDVEWGPSASRRRLNSLGASGRSFNIPVTVYKCELDRGL